MADAYQKAEWLRVGIAVTWLVNRNGWTRDPITLNQVIPPAYRPPVPKPPPRTPEQIALDSRLGWHALDCAFGGKAKGK